MRDWADRFYMFRTSTNCYFHRAYVIALRVSNSNFSEKNNVYV